MYYQYVCFLFDTAAPLVMTSTERGMSNLTLYRTPAVDAGSHYIFIISRASVVTFQSHVTILLLAIALSDIVPAGCR